MPGLRELAADDPCRDLATDILTMRGHLEECLCKLDRHLKDVQRRVKGCGGKLTAVQVHEIESHCARVEKVIEAIKRR